MPVKIILKKDKSGGFVATVPSIPGCISQGETKDQALANIKEAISLHTKSLIVDHKPTIASKKNLKNK